MTQTLPPSPSLEHLKNQAKALQAAVRAGEPEALSRVQTHLPRISVPAFALSQAQFVLAREYGFASWPRLKGHVNAIGARLEARPVTQAPPPAPPKPRMHAHIEEMARHLEAKPEVIAFAEEIMSYADTGDVEQVLQCLGRLGPLRLILAVRGIIVQSGRHAVVVDALIRGLEHPDPRVRHMAAGAMDHLADERCAEPLGRALWDPVPRVRRAALHSLSCEDCKVTPLQTCEDYVALFSHWALHDESIRTRRGATWSLGGDRYDPRAVATLAALLATETDEAVLRNARWALKHQEKLAAKEKEA